METVYLAGGCLWGIQAFIKTLPGVHFTETGRANGTSQTIEGDQDGFTECVKTAFDPSLVTIEELAAYLFEVLDPCSINEQGEDTGEKYRTGIYSENPEHIKRVEVFFGREGIMI